MLADKSNESIEWLDKHGATLSHVGQGGGSSAARMHGPADGAFVGPYLSKFFRDEAAKSNLDLRLNTKLVKLIKGTNGEITGALVKGKHTGIYQIDAKAVILATGGIGANPELIQKLRPDISPEVKTSNQPGSQATVSSSRKCRRCSCRCEGNSIESDPSCRLSGNRFRDGSRSRCCLCK